MVSWHGRHPLVATAGPHDEERSASARGRRTGHERLTGLRRTGRRRTRWRTLTSGAPSHVQEWRTHRNRRSYWRTHRDRSADGNGRTHGYRSANRNGSAHRHWRTNGNRRTHWNGRDNGHRPRQGHGNTSHVSEWSTSGTARGSSRSACDCRRCSVARRRLETLVSARHQRGGRRARAQRQGGSAQPSAGNHFDAGPIGDRHNVNSLIFAQIRTQSTGSAEPQSRTEVVSDDRVN